MSVKISLRMYVVLSKNNNIQKSGASNSTFVIGVHFVLLLIVEGWGYGEKPLVLLTFPNQCSTLLEYT